MLSSLGGYLAECVIISSLFFFKFKVILRRFVVLVVLCSSFILKMLNYMPWVMMWLAVECKRAYKVPYYNSSKICYWYHFEHFFPSFFLLDQINFKCFYFDAFACWLLILHKHFIFIHCSASFTLMRVPKGLEAAYAADRVWEWEFYLFQIYLTAFYSFWFAMMWPRYPDTTIVSPVSALARSLTLKFEF